MSWVKVDDSFWSDPNVLIAGNEAAGVFVRMLSFCGQHLTDGHVAPDIARFISSRKKPLEELEAVGFIAPNDNGFVVPDYLDFNPSRDQVQTERAKAARRMSLNRDPQFRRAIRERDGDTCRYCGESVNWGDRRSTRGGTYDHIDPKGSDELTNVVVACRGCNSRKGSRTPEQAGMELIPTKNGLERD